MTSPLPGTGARLSLATVAAVLLALCLLLYMRPYYGIRLDSILYLGQALMRSNPGELGQDLFFAHGSQAQFTLFPQLVAALLQHFSAADLFRALTLAGQVGFAIASFVLIRQLLPDPHRLWSLLAVLAMPSGYGGFNMFAYSESFATGRSLAEPLGLLALAAVLGRHWYWGGAAWLLAAALHPLQALPVALVAWICLMANDRRWLHLLWPAALAGLLLYVRGSGGSSILLRYDSEWLEWIVAGPRQVFVLQWRLEDWCYLLTDVFLVALVARTAQAPLGHFARAMLVATLVAFSASVLLADVLHFVLPTGLQAWRVQWLLHWLAMATLPWQLLRLHGEGGRERVRTLMLLAIAVLGTSFGPISPPLAVLLLIPLFLAWPRIRAHIRPLLEGTLMAAIALSLLIAFASLTLDVLDRFARHGASREVLRPEFVIATYPLVIGGLLVLALAAWHYGRLWVRSGLFVILIAWLGYAALNWDRRSTAARHVETASASSLPFGVSPAPGAQVFWGEDPWTEELLAAWLTLGRPSYFSRMHTSGLPFNRGTAEEANERRKTWDIFDLHRTACGLASAPDAGPDACLPDAETIRRMCMAAKGKLTYFVMPKELQHGSLGRWSVPAERKGDRLITYHLYQCADFSAQAGIGTS